ncbi:MAG: hypothetical protein U1F66_02200 [bacterium]
MTVTLAQGSPAPLPSGPRRISPALGRQANARLLALSLGQETLREVPEEDRRLEAYWGRATLRELRSLEVESDPRLYFEALGNLASRLAQQENLEPAQRILAFIAAGAVELDPVSAQRAQRELDAMEGRGATGPRLEFLARRFAREASSPSMLVGMTAASAVFQFSRLALLSRLTASPTASFLTRGLGARGLASLGAFAVEAPAFALSARGTRWVLGEAGAVEAPLGREILASYLTLGGLKLFGGLGRAGVRLAGSGALSRALLPQFSTYLGILAGHRLEQWAGLRPPQSNDTWLTDSLVTLLQFHVGGRLAQELGGPRLAAWQGGMELRSEELAQASRPGPWLAKPAEVLAPALVGATEGPRLPHILLMQGGENGTGPRPARSPAARGNGARSSVPLGERNAYQVVQEMIRCRERLSRRGEELSLWQVLRRKLEEGAIPAERAEELQWAVFARALFDNSAILQREFRQGAPDSLEGVAQRLRELRVDIAKEQGQSSYSLATLVQALAFGGRIPFERTRQYLSAAASLDFYLETPALQTVGKSHFSDPYRLVRRLRELAPGIEAQREHRYKLSTLVDALRWHPQFPKTQLQTYVMVAAASDYVRDLPLERLRLDTPSLRELDLEQVFLRLLHLKTLLLGDSGEPVSIGYVLAGLRSHGLERIKGGALNDSAITNAHVLDFAYNHWAQWGGHYRNLSEIPKNGEGTGTRAGWTRPRYAERFLLKENGQPYSYSYAGNLVRWGEFLWRHREALQLPEPGAIEVAPLASSRRSRLFAFLEPQWEALREKAQVPESFFENLLALRRDFLGSGEERSAVEEGEPGSPPSLKIMVGAFFKAKGRVAPRTLEVYAAVIDTILQRWPEWRRHLRSLSEVSEPGHAGARERYRIAEQNFLQANGEPYSRTLLGSLIRWGSWVWNNRGSLGLRSGESTMPPPSEAGGRKDAANPSPGSKPDEGNQ